MKDMPEFYDHVEEEIESEMKYLNKLLKEAKWQQWTPTSAQNTEWVKFELPWQAGSITDTGTLAKHPVSYAEYRWVNGKVEYRVVYKASVLCLYCGKDVSAFTKDGNIYVGSCTRCNPDPTREIRFINFSTGKTPTKIKFYYIGDEEE